MRRGGRRALVIFTRAPRPGRVKTRLAATLGDARAMAIHRELTERTVAAARTLGHTELTMAFTPAGAEEEMRGWLGIAPRFEQQRGATLGARLTAAIEARLAAGCTDVIVVGSDAPDLTPALLEEAFAALERSDVVIGPASDGGYYLIGMGALHRTLFEDIPWSTAETLARTLAAARQAALRVHVLDILDDIDTADDWHRWLRRQGRPPD